MSERVQANFDDARERLVNAANVAGVDPAVVIRIAGFESAGFDPNARPVTGRESVDVVRQFDGTMAMSSAHGYGQFTNATWQDVVNRHGERYGVAGAGDLSLAEANTTELRTNRDLQAAMLAEFTRENVQRGRALGETDDNVAAYAMHNLGGAGGRRFLQALAEDPQQPVDAALTPVEIRNNPALYRNNGELVTLDVARQRMQGHLSRYDDYVEQARDHHPEAFMGLPAQAAPLLPEPDRSPDRFDDASHWRGTEFANARTLMHDLDRDMGLTPGDTTDRVAAALTAEWHAQSARGSIDGVVLGQKGSKAAAGEYMFAYSGSSQRPNDFVGVRTSEAVQTPVEQSMARAQEAVQKQSQDTQLLAQTHAQQQANDGPRMSLG